MNQQIRVLTLTQPWATLVAIGAKRIETRSWSTTYRGRIAIHAAKGFPRQAQELTFTDPFRGVLERHGWSLDDLKAVCGHILCTAELVSCHQTPPAGIPWRTYANGLTLPPDEPERSFGDYSPGRYGWLLRDVQVLAASIPAKGALGLWRWTGDLPAAQVPA